ncbi:hypothetical protein PS627_00514 [Pseudomonas fluorescens]|uniref:phytanoyl-CoA dioxygenase family protein n=1 Tax=Pseudomonas fluorescens TaxID=294 RepID=UPI001254CE7C|nr:phytanoyl-CoA dioxygenase family protein [Pseudomonas fluorescens]CAG8863576.1 hypothetical protein PS627_00514 [Pseudomonas fluorescens]VVP84825.1 hypothetical protein PS910_02315 [Pseudomonas fluorescens]
MVLEEQLHALRDDGFVHVRAVLDASQVALLRGAIDQLRPIHWDYQGLLEHYKCVFNRDPLWLPFLDLPGLIELAEAVLGDDCHIIGQTAWRSHPGYPGMALHLDHLPLELPGWVWARADFHLPVQVFTAQMYLTDVDVRTGPTSVIPGSHRAGRAPLPGEVTWQGQGAMPLLCKAGDVLVFRSELWHAGGANTSQGHVRDMLQVHYARRMVAQKFSPYLDWQFNPQVLVAASERQRRLLGEHAEAEYD